MTSEEDGSARHQPNTECADPPKVRLFTTKTRISRKKKSIYILKVVFMHALGEQRARSTLRELTQLWATARRNWIIRQAAL